MPKMSGCSTFIKMCGNNPQLSVNKQCLDSKIPKLPSSAYTTQAIHSICSSMSMEGCNDCKITNPNATYASCDLLKVYSYLCSSMPDMSECKEFKTMCADTPELPYCPGSSSEVGGIELPPAMKMFFHTGAMTLILGFSDYLLFEGWVPRSAGTYAIACLSIVLLGILYEGISAYLMIQEIKWGDRLKLANGRQACDQSTSANSAQIFANQSRSKIAIFSYIGGYYNGSEGVKIASIRAVFKFFMVAISYSLMLIAMTFNIGFFFSVCLGFAAGSFLFSSAALAASLENSIAHQLDTSGCCQN